MKLLSATSSIEINKTPIRRTEINLLGSPKICCIAQGAILAGTFLHQVVFPGGSDFRAINVQLFVYFIGSIQSPFHKILLLLCALTCFHRSNKKFFVAVEIWFPLHLSHDMQLWVLCKTKHHKRHRLLDVSNVQNNHKNMEDNTKIKHHPQFIWRLSSTFFYPH